ncbi:GIY-YIG nuclease family protein [Patescibacteria group bacterium]|nr:GIY-YIG nuclease family protein [Patescibacteria group bacterium]MBU1759139.1 GIY-YIG nuclease family protein [Patescibacteria group bacterium]MBU1907315.1 GIY-YIG nuclease family protein [Patescibacteria group bacterium]
MYYVYILKNIIDGSLYKGFTTDIDARLKEHRKGTTKTTKREGGHYELVWYCAFSNKKQALDFEQYLKSGSGRAFTNKRLV